MTKKGHYADVTAKVPTEEGCKDVTIRWLISKDDGAKNFAMRLFEVQPGGYTPYHQHDWEHEVFILEGDGELKLADGPKPYTSGEFIYIPAMEWHQFKNTGKKLNRFLCLVPYKG